MAKDRENNTEEAENSGEKKSESPSAKSKAAAKPKGKAPILDLERLKNSSATQAPKASSKEPKGSFIPTRRAKEAPGPKLSWKFSIIAGVSCMLVGLCTHIFGINSGFVLNDRFNLVYLICRSFLEQISKSVLVDMLGANPLSQPWLKASFIGDFGEYGLNLNWYHVSEVFWHAFISGLVFFYILTMGRYLRHQNRLELNPHHLALVASLLFACHPLTCETVSYLSTRSVILGTVNYFLSLDTFLLAALIKHPIARVLMFMLSLYTGAMSVWSNPECMTLPAMALLSLLIIKGPLSKWDQSVKEHPFLCSTSFALAAGLPFFYFRGIEFTKAIYLFVPTLSTPAYLASQAKAFVFYYLRSAFFPLGLSIDPPLAIANGPLDYFAIAAIVIIAALLYLIVKTKQPILWLATTIVIIGIFPHIIYVQPDVVADWVAYLPLVGLMIFPAYAICKLSEVNFFRAAVITVTLAVTFMGLSIYRDAQWSSSYALWQSALVTRPKSALAHANLAIELLKREELDEADKHAQLAVSYAPELVIARIAQAKVLEARSKYTEAFTIFGSALKLAEKQKLAQVARYECLFGQLECLIGQNKDRAANELLMKLAPELQGREEPRLLYLVGMSAFNGKNYEKALIYLDKAVGNDPSLIESYRPMAESALAMGNFAPAYTAASMNLNLVGGYSSKLLFARSALMADRRDEAEDILKQILSQNPKDARALYLLARLYKHVGKAEEYKKFNEEAVKIDRDIAIKYALPELDAADSGKK
jgi:tetratricopeptide (TPR) repeat protein